MHRYSTNARPCNLVWPALLGLTLVGCAADRGVDSVPGPGGADPGDPDGEQGDTAGEPGDDGDDGGVKFDTPDGDSSGPNDCDDPDGNCGCSFVDLLFVIDSSHSMDAYQEALVLAFPRFVDTLAEALPPDTNVHVGVTSTEMGYTYIGKSEFDPDSDECTFTGDGGRPYTDFYVTPDVTDTGKNGAQGRLHKPGGSSQAYFELDTGTDTSALHDWFREAALVGEDGANIEMLTAPLGWVADPANDATNHGFWRDAGSVTVFFFLQDEADQTPETIDGKPGGQWVLDRVAAAKTDCGGLDCVVAGGLINDLDCGGRPLATVLEAIPDTAIGQLLELGTLPRDDPAAAADKMNEILADTLSKVITDKCDQIPPVG